jgi:uncharacterized Fe-S radical SAM superfamily protein PflX
LASEIGGTTFTVRTGQYQAAYLRLGVEAIERRAAEAVAALGSCQVCPRNCRVDRLQDRKAVCRSGRHALVASHFPHFGEEDCLRGSHGSGTIFFSWCNLRCVFCCHPDTPVLTDQGMVRIAALFALGGEEMLAGGGAVRQMSGPQVLARHGKLAPVLRAFSHPYRGDLMVVKPYGLPALKLTPDHTVFAALEPGGEVHKLPARGLTQRHYLVVPKPKVDDLTVELDVRALLSPFVGTFRRSTPRRVSLDALRGLIEDYESRRITSGEIAVRFSCHPAYVRTLISRLRRGVLDSDRPGHRNDLVEQGGRIRFKTEKGPGVLARLVLDEELARLIGYYCAEGHVTSQAGRPNSHRLIFSYGPHEMELATRTVDLIERVFQIRASVVHRRTTISVEVGAASLALLFVSFAGAKSHHKRAPHALWSTTRAVVRAFLEGYFQGDGCRQATVVAANTVSEELALGLVGLLLRLGIFPYFYATGRPSRQTIEGRRVQQSETLYYVKCRREAWEGRSCGSGVRPRETGDSFWVPIRQISRLPYDGPVYNLEVADEDHAYTASGVAVGNCQNADVSQAGEGQVVSPERLAAMMLELQARGCHNINFVTPEHVVPQILEALPLAIRGGLRLPLVYNTSAYDSLESLRWMDGIVDIYMPDFKVWDRDVAKRYLKAPDYPEAARAAIREMHRQVGPLAMDEQGLAKRGVLVRHLVMPGMLEETRQIMTWLARELGPDTYVNVMGQYYPAGAVSAEKYPEINRKLVGAELDEARRLAREAGLWRLDERRPRRRPLWG